MAARPCTRCGTPTRNGPRCTLCEQAHQQGRNKRRTHYQGDYRKRAAQTRATPTPCWLCGKWDIPGDPWQADHIQPTQPDSPLARAHRSCNASRGNKPPPPPQGGTTTT